MTKCVTLCYIPAGGVEALVGGGIRVHFVDQIVKQDLPFQFQPAHLTPNKLKDQPQSLNFDQRFHFIRYLLYFLDYLERIISILIPQKGGSRERAVPMWYLQW